MKVLILALVQLVLAQHFHVQVIHLHGWVQVSVQLDNSLYQQQIAGLNQHIAALTQQVAMLAQGQLMLMQSMQQMVMSIYQQTQKSNSLGHNETLNLLQSLSVDQLMKSLSVSQVIEMIDSLKAPSLEEASFLYPIVERLENSSSEEAELTKLTNYKQLFS